MTLRSPGLHWFVRPEACEQAPSILRERFGALGIRENHLAQHRRFGALLDQLETHAPYLAELALRESRCLRMTVALGPDRIMTMILDRIKTIPFAGGRSHVAAAMRQAKRQAALTIAIADLARYWRLERVTLALSNLADATLRLAVRHLLHANHQAGEFTLADPERPDEECGFVVLGMGKLGAQELNYSSDIDLILLFDPSTYPYHIETIGGTFTRLARDLVALMSNRDADGYVFRTDLRLRPDPSATPPAISLPAALIYYESMGQTWERAAMIKARPIAGDLIFGERFLADIQPFIWRRHLDFAAIADLHAMKRRIDAHSKRGPGLAKIQDLRGHNLKLGTGGIREIEFITQTLQLVWAGRDPDLRGRTTLDVLSRLRRAGHLGGRAAGELGVAYRVLRRIEHRLQMVSDRQTHSLPATDETLTSFFRFAGDGRSNVAETLLRHLQRVHRHYTEFFGPGRPRRRGLEDGLDPIASDRLRAIGFQEPDRVMKTIVAWRDGRLRALRSTRARDLLDRFLPVLLTQLARQGRPDQAFARFDEFLSRLSAGVQILSLFERNPKLIARLAMVLGAAPSLADHLSQVPGAIEGLLASPGCDPDPGVTLGVQLRDAIALEDTIAITRRYVRGEEFRLSVEMLDNIIDIDAAEITRTGLADAAIAALLSRVMDEHAMRGGIVPGGGMVVVALGKAGGREMMPGSDLDLMLIYDHPADMAMSNGSRPIPASQYFTRAAHSFVAALTAPGPEGPLYTVDMRLRPSGSKGPVAVSLPAFRHYHAESAWTWERMALTRARVVAGPPVLRRRVAAAIRAALCRPCVSTIVKDDARKMRLRMRRERPSRGVWDVRNQQGGLVDIEFITQVLQLQHARRSPGILVTNTVTAIEKLANIGVLDGQMAAMLIASSRFWRIMQSTFRITLGKIPATDPNGSVLDALLAATCPASGDPLWNLAALRTQMTQHLAEIQALFVLFVGDQGRG